MNNISIFLTSKIRRWLFSVLISFLSFSAFSQNNFVNSFLTPADTLNRQRYNTALAFSAVSYSAFTYGLYNIWYRQYDQEAFHLYNDYGEWRNMDKFGHLYTAYFETALFYKGMRWAGQEERKALIAGLIAGNVFQGTLEVMDGFSTEWGFSIPDMAFNLAGSGVFAAQQVYWKEQRIRLKVSNIPRAYDNSPLPSINDPNSTSSLQQRAINLYGSSFAERFIKDYNSQTIWASINISSFLPEESNYPDWLNIAIGVGAGNLFGGYENTWREDEVLYGLETAEYRRHTSFYISPDIDFSKLKSKYPLVKTSLEIMNLFKLPLPTIEYNTLGEMHFHWFL